MRATSGRETGCRYATIDSVSACAGVSPGVRGRDQQAPRRLLGVGMRRERPAARQLAQHDPAALERDRQRAQPGGDLVLLDAQRVGQLLDRHGVGSEEQQRLQVSLELHHATSPTAGTLESARTVIGPNDSAWSQSASPLLYSSSSAKSVTATVMRSPALHRLVEGERPPPQQRAQQHEALGQPDPRHCEMAQVDRRRRAQQSAERLAEHGRVVRLLGMLEWRAAQRRRKRRRAIEHALLGLPARGQKAPGAAEAGVGEHPLEQLLGRLGRRQVVELLDLLARQHQARLQLQQRGDQHEELGRGLEVQLVARLQMVQVGEHDLGQLDLEQVQLVAQDQRQQQVERPGEDVEVQLQRVIAVEGTSVAG